MSVKPAHLCTLFFFWRKTRVLRKEQTLRGLYANAGNPPHWRIGQEVRRRSQLGHVRKFIPAVGRVPMIWNQEVKILEEKANNFLETEKIGRLMRKYSVPCIISLVVAALYNIVDQIFIANADYLGSYGNAANTVVFPLTVVALAIAVMIGDGCCAFVSISLGAGILFLDRAWSSFLYVRVGAGQSDCFHSDLL